jgi:hypothetical protein
MPDPKSAASNRIDLLSTLREMPDPRVERTKLHKFEDLLLIAICALLCGAESFGDMEPFGDTKEPWLRTFLELPHGIPSRDTFNRLFAALDPQRFLDAFMRWTQNLRTALGGEVVAIDGKALRRAIAAGQSLKVVVGAWVAGNGLVLGQRRVEDKSNEITAVPELLCTLELAGCIVTLDAMGCQRRIAREAERRHRLVRRPGPMGRPAQRGRCRIGARPPRAGQHRAPLLPQQPGTGCGKTRARRPQPLGRGEPTPTGCSTWSLVKAEAAPAPATPPKTSPPCGAGRSTSSKPTPTKPNAPSKAKSKPQAGITITCFTS